VPSRPLPPFSSALKEFVIAFAGNPNVGKTALINALSGSRLKVGNWPGVTVEKKEAQMVCGDYQLRLIDLPGTYSLNPFTLEERVCRDFLLLEKPDLLINVVDTSNLEKSLYLTFQLLDMEIPMVMALNMWDEFTEKGYSLNQDLLSAELGIPVVATAGPSKWGVDSLLNAALESLQSPQLGKALVFSEPLENAIQALSLQIENEVYAEKTIPLRWLTLKLLERDSYTLAKIKEIHNQDLTILYETDREPLVRQAELERNFSQSRSQAVARLAEKTLKAPAKPKLDWTDRVDRVLLNEWTGLPVFMAVLYLVFKLTFDISTPLVDFIDGFFNGFVAKWAEMLFSSLSVPAFLLSLLKDGVIGGVGLVLSFVPILIFLYLFLALLEESGYMARAAFLMDRFMFRFGLHGKAFVPLLVGFGCNVPAVYASRALENQTDRKITVAVLSFMSCGAKLPIYALFTSVFFVAHQALVILLLYLIGIGVAIFWAVILRKTRFKSDIPAFVMELPPYRVPSVKMLWGSIWLKTRAFIKQAGTVIAVAMILLWSLVNLPYGAPTEQTVLARSAQTIAPLFLPLGFGNRWEPVAAILPGFMAKEMVVGTLGVVLSVQQEPAKQGNTSFSQDLLAQGQSFLNAGQKAISSISGNLLPAPFVLDAGSDSPLTAKIREAFTPLSAFSYMVFNLLLLSCISVVGAVVHEFGRSYMGFILFLTCGTAYTVAALVYNGGLLLGLG
jgi:ferrous iron transport protein B